MQETNALSVRALNCSDRRGWIRLFEAYQADQGIRVARPDRATLFTAACDASNPSGCLIALFEGRVVAFLHYDFKPIGNKDENLIVVQDFFIYPDHRTKQIGARLLRELHVMGIALKAPTVLWPAAENLFRGRKLADPDAVTLPYHLLEKAA
jgi:GNAT superfamily N-acetyltransferase